MTRTEESSQWKRQRNLNFKVLGGESFESIVTGFEKRNKTKEENCGEITQGITIPDG